MNCECFDVLVVGGGLVGASLALALSRHGRRVGLIEGLQPPRDGLTDANDWDSRVYAVSPANRAFLDSLNAWPDMSRGGTGSAMDGRGGREVLARREAE